MTGVYDSAQLRHYDNERQKEGGKTMAKEREKQHVFSAGTTEQGLKTLT